MPLPPVSSSLQCVVPELRGDGVPHGPPSHPEGPEHDPSPGAASLVHSRALQGVSPGHHPDGQPEEVSVHSGRAAGVGMQGFWPHLGLDPLPALPRPLDMWWSPWQSSAVQEQINDPVSLCLVLMFSMSSETHINY